MTGAGSFWFANPSSGFYNGVATQSLRLDGGSQITLDNAGSATSNKIATISTWFKRADELTTLAYLFHSKNDGSFGDGSNGLASFSITLDAADTISVVQYNGNTSFNANQYDFGVVASTRKFRDMSSWYHLVVAIDTTQGSGTTNEADRIKMYVNGEQQTVVAISDGSGYQDFADENQLIAVNQDGEQRWGGTVDDGTYAHVYLAETNVVDGLQLDASYFGETKNGVWIPKAPVVSDYGNHGYRLQYKQSSVGSGSSSTIGADTSGKDNHFTSSGIVASDCNMPDSPENNFATLSPLSVGGGSKSSMNGGASNRTFAEGNLQVSLPDNTWAYNTQVCYSGKWYCEILVKTIGSSDQDNGVGWNHYDNFVGAGSMAGYADSWNVYSNTYSTPYIKLYDETSALGNTFAVTLAEGDIWQLAWDVDSGKGWIGLNNTYYRTNATDGNPSAGSNQTFDFTTEEAQNLLVALGNGNGTNVYVANFGQDGSFAGNKTAQGNTDANGIGDFYYAVPTGFQAVCTKNLADTAIGPNSATQSDDYFNTVLYTGNSTNNHAITGVGFKPDWVWIKKRNETSSHFVVDSSRGLANEDDGNGNARQLATNANYAEDDTSNNTGDGGMASFDSDGFTLGKGSYDANADSAYQRNNSNNDTFVAWNWKANGGTTSSDSNGSITSAVQANTTAGFSIVTYTGNATSGATVGHGLGVAPKIVIHKNRDDAQDWQFRTTAIDGSHDILNLNNTNTKSDSARNAPTSTVFSLGSGAIENGNGNDFVAYVFAEVEGYSKFGSFTGNGSADGPFVYTGFRPAWVMYKRTDSSDYWAIFDSIRSTANVMQNRLAPNYSLAEDVSTANQQDFLSNGFKLRGTDTTTNASGGTYIYMAFAEAPFKYANGR
jgi:hypothetical protein